MKPRPIFAPPKEKGAPNKVLVVKNERLKEVMMRICF